MRSAYERLLMAPLAASAPPIMSNVTPGRGTSSMRPRRSPYLVSSLAIRSSRRRWTAHSSEGRAEPGRGSGKAQKWGEAPGFGIRRSAFSNTRSSTRIGTLARRASAMASEGRASTARTLPPTSR